MVYIKAINANGGHVDGNASETIDGAAIQDMNQWDCLQLFCNGTAWFIL